MSYNVIQRNRTYTLLPETLMYKIDEFQLSELRKNLCSHKYTRFIKDLYFMSGLAKPNWKHKTTLKLYKVDIQTGATETFFFF
jgi:hypothetical protein